MADRGPRTGRRVAAAAGVLVLLAGTAPPLALGAPATTSGAFAGHWVGHTRTLVIHRAGRAAESIGSGCCDPVVDLSFRLTSRSGGSDAATATIRVTKVVVRDPGAYSEDAPAPRVGQRGRLRLRDGVITESVTGTNYCDEAAGRRGACGA